MGTLTINTTAQQDARLVEAFGTMLGTVDEAGVPRNATGPEVKAAVVEWIRGVVTRHELDKARRAVAVTPFEPT